MISNIAGGFEVNGECQPKLGSQYKRSSVWIHNLIKQYLSIIR